MATTFEEQLAEMKRAIERQDAELEVAKGLVDDLRFVPTDVAQRHLRMLDEACEETMVVHAPAASMPFALRA